MWGGMWGVDFLSQMARGLLELLVLIKGCGQWCTGDRVAAECISNCTTCASSDLCKYFAQNTFLGASSDMCTYFALLCINFWY